MFDNLLIEGIVGVSAGLLYKPKTAAGYALKGAIGALIIYALVKKKQQPKI